MKKAARLVHYAAQGRGGLVFDCYRKAWREHEESEMQGPLPGASTWQNHAARKFTYPQPKCHTDLGRVTCPECWAWILEMARKRQGARK